MKDRYRHFKNPQFRWSILWAFVLFIASLFINFYAGIYATEKASNPVTDIILSNTRTYDLDTLFVYATWAFVAFILYVCLKKPWKAPFILKSIALFVLIRAVFITLTHIGPYPTQIAINPQSFLNYFIFGGDLFFSGHTGLPFLLALVFWHNDNRMRNIFLATSLFFSVIVLLAHLHYTIDVLSAFFISYGIFHIASLWFTADRKLFLTATVPE